MQWFVIQMLIFLVVGHYVNKSFTKDADRSFHGNSRAPNEGQHLRRIGCKMEPLGHLIFLFCYERHVSY